MGEKKERLAEGGENETKEVCKCTIHAHFCATGGHQLQEVIELKDSFEQPRVLDI